MNVNPCVAAPAGRLQVGLCITMARGLLSHTFPHSHALRISPSAGIVMAVLRRFLQDGPN